MLKESVSPDKHLASKMKHIVVTNVCNLTCGGCHQHCGNFDKSQLWFISPEEFDRYISILKRPPNRIKFRNPHYVTKVSVFGGEPTIHPQWRELVEIMRSHEDVLFRVSTNGRLQPDAENPYPNMKMNMATLKYIVGIEQSIQKLEDNVLYLIDPKDEEKIASESFVPILVAPSDLYPERTQRQFWLKAQKDCGVWKYCSAAIYNNKAYFCEVAAAMDHLLYDGANGWEITDEPFNRTPEEINEQAEKFCHRCAWCIKNDPKLEQYEQRISEPTLVSESNMKCFPNPEGKFLVQITLPND